LLFGIFSSSIYSEAKDWAIGTAVRRAAAIAHDVEERPCRCECVVNATQCLVNVTAQKCEAAPDINVQISFSVGAFAFVLGWFGKFITGRRPSASVEARKGKGTRGSTFQFRD